MGSEGALTVHEGDMIASSVEGRLTNSIPNVRRVHVHYHPADKNHENMTIDDILAESQKHASPYQPQYYE